MTVPEKKLLKDIFDAIEAIDFHLNFQKDFSKYCANRTVKRAVERELEIIGEAVSKLLKINPDVEISSARLIVDLRNRVIHAYDAVDDVIVWKVIIKDLPVLKSEVERLLNN